MPIHWDELADRNLRPQRWTVKTAPRRLEHEGDAWRDMARQARSIKL
jgi:DNA primase